jgi:hypothetical protein
MNNKKKLSATLIIRAERSRAAEFDDALTVRERDSLTRADDHDGRESLVWELDGFRFNDGDWN